MLIGIHLLYHIPPVHPIAIPARLTPFSIIFLLPYHPQILPWPPFQHPPIIVILQLSLLQAATQIPKAGQANRSWTDLDHDRGLAGVRLPEI